MKGKTLTAGAYLKEKREQKGLSLEELSSITRISISVLKAIEEDIKGDLPEPIFVKGFIKSYAKVLGIDYLKPLAIYEKTLSSDLKPIKYTAKDSKNVNKGALISSLILVVALLSTWFAYSKTKKTEDKTDKVLVVKQEQTIEKDPQKEIKNDKETKLTIALEKKVEKETTSIKEPEKNTIKITAKRVVWIKVQIDDKQVFDFMMQPSTEREFNYDKEIKFLFGDASAVDITYNGRPFNFKSKVGAVRTIIFPSLERWQNAMDI